MKQNWVNCLLGDIVILKNGYAFKSLEYQNTGVPIVRISDINESIVELSDSKCIFENEEFDKFQVESGDILIAMSGATTGKFGIYKGTKKAYQNQRVGNLKPISPKNSNKDFLYYLLFSLKREIEKKAYGGAQPNISSSNIEAIEIALPPLLEQQRIVAKIEELFSELDQGVNNLMTAQAQLKVYRQALLKQAFEGKLTEQWRRDNQDQLESASDLQKRIQEERSQRYQQQLQEWETDGKQGGKPKAPKTLASLSAEELFELPDLPNGWSYTKIGNLIDDPTYGTSKKCDYETDGIGVLRIPNVVSGKIDSTDLKFASFTEEEIATYKLNSGDILIIRSNGSVSIVGRCALIAKADVNYLYAGYLIRLRPLRNLVQSKYLLNAFLLHGTRKQIEKKAKSTSGVNNINTGEIQSLVIALCGTEEQEQIVLTLESKLSSIDQLELTITTALKQSEALRQSILKKAFSGQLVPQDANDEPASVLLARIKAEKAAMADTPKKARSKGSLHVSN
ncbi:MAG: restriction endonuclease subunit S [Candidatus Aquirickettsiella gammari]